MGEFVKLLHRSVHLPGRARQHPVAGPSSLVEWELILRRLLEQVVEGVRALLEPVVQFVRGVQQLLQLLALLVAPSQSHSLLVRRWRRSGLDHSLLLLLVALGFLWGRVRGAELVKAGRVRRGYRGWRGLWGEGVKRAGCGGGV